MTNNNPLANIISTKIIEKIIAGTLTTSEAKDLNSKILTDYLNQITNTIERLKRSTQIFDFWKQILQNAHSKSKTENFYAALNTIIDASPTSMLAQFTKLYQNTAIIDPPYQKFQSTEIGPIAKPNVIQKININPTSQSLLKDTTQLKNSAAIFSQNTTLPTNKIKTSNSKKRKNLQKST